ncbi:MAG: hypothetical protein KKE62_10550 [Proteobacteria bacterium]|nr:hypothetical protein [Pseudomonadota bacterium]MBU1386655.1 hypothetical protein [Pseudomonadota bacterium]MBU1543266.1 hypothetical protein [Pseudomonadota bacterium]MBU2482178.1 hypothetical protein [Pseudomonadota bacterium]
MKTRCAKRISGCLVWLVFVLIPMQASALVNYEAGRLEVEGILLLQDAADKNQYYYLPPAPRVSVRADGNLELSVIKFVDPKGDTSGGLFHMLISLSLPAEDLEVLQSGLKKIKPDAKISGPVPLIQNEDAGFSIISGTLTDKNFTTSIISSGRAPVTPGSKAAVAATLSPHGATLLWESLQKPTSDVSIALRTYYEASLPSFQAKIHAQVSTVYTHFSKLKNVQSGYDKKQIRDIVDELVRTGDIKIDVMDRMPEEAANKAMQSMVDLVAGKLTEVIFDQKTGFTAIPEKEKAVEEGQIAGRQKKGWLSKLFTSTGNQKYYSDNQYVLKKREDINRAVFSINLNRRAVIKVPVDTAGNISGLYKEFSQNPDMFRVVNLSDPAFQKRELFFRIDGDYTGAFENIMNYAGISIQKTYKGQADATGELVFTREDIRDGRLSKSWTYARLGEKSTDWLDFDYCTTWSIQGQHRIRQPEDPEKWLKSADPIITIAPPLERMDLEIDADRFLFEDAQMRSATLEVKYKIFNEEKIQRFAVMRATDAESVVTQVLFHDPGKKAQYRVNWYPVKGEPQKGQWIDLNETYLVLTPPGI